MQNPIVTIGHKVLELNFIYDFYQNVVGGVNYRNSYVQEILEHNGESSNILDLGSGTSEIVEVFSEKHNYIGLDYSSEYLAKAKKRENNCSSFQVFKYDLSKSGWSEIVRNNVEKKKSIDAIALGLLHHLDDQSATTLLKEVHDTIQENGSVYSVDPIITKDTTQIAKWFAKNDRGRFVRSEKDLLKLFTANGFELEINIKRNQFRIPLDTVEIKATPI
jgi:cyclopropane fatty-acyl-phospholipid synthase-like methyltransferase